jgi:hypothetical protein
LPPRAKPDRNVETHIVSSPDLEQSHLTVLEERRRIPRQRLGRLATLKLGVGIAPRFVLVTNSSAEGVRLQLNGLETFDEFVLLFHGNGGPARDGTYKVVWRQGHDVGAKFINTVTENT